MQLNRSSTARPHGRLGDMRRLAVRGTLAMLLLLAPTAHAGPTDGRLDVYWVDVEGGAATLLVTPTGESILIDTGLPGERDPGRINKLAREVAGLERIDHLVVTHFDLDHYGGAADLSKLIPIVNHYDHGVRDEDRQRVGEAYLNFKCEKRHVLKPGDAIELKQLEGHPKVTIDVLAALQQFIPPAPRHQRNGAICATAEEKRPDTSHNANSIVLLIKCGDFDMLDAADLTWNLEAKLVCPVNLVGEVDVYQVDHHGLDSSNNPVLIRTIRPTVAVMNNGDRKGCMPDTVTTLRSVESIQAIYQVHRCLRTENLNTLSAMIANVAAGSQCEGHHIKLSVSPDGREYRVSVPSTGHEKTYASR